MVDAGDDAPSCHQHRVEEAQGVEARGEGLGARVGEGEGELLGEPEVHALVHQPVHRRGRVVVLGVGGGVVERAGDPGEGYRWAGKGACSSSACCLSVVEGDEPRSARTVGSAASASAGERQWGSSVRTAERKRALSR